MTRSNEKSGIGARAPSPFHVEIDRVQGGVAVLISGVRGIRELTDATVLLRLKGGFIRVVGTGVSLTVYENRTVEVIGGVERIEIENDKT